MQNLNTKTNKYRDIHEILSRLDSNIDSLSINKKVNNIFDRIDNAKTKKEANLTKQELSTLDQFIRIHEFEKHILLSESLPAKFSSMAINMAKSMIAEYKCTTVLEKSIVELIVNAFCRSLYLSSLMVVVFGQEPVQIHQNFINYYNFIGKELDRANREYLTAITTLHQLKSPHIQLNLKAETAILGQNQQFNSITDAKNENN